jgi:hypothetical protein
MVLLSRGPHRQAFAFQRGSAVAIAFLSSACVVLPPAASAPRAPVAAEAIASEGAPPAPPAPPPAPKDPELPRGGRTLFPDYELVGFCGTPGGPALGELTGNLPKKSDKLEAYADKYVTGRKVLPVFELIAVVVLAGPGSDGKYRRRVADSVVDEYLALARQHKGILLLNIQPGMSDFLTELQHFDKYLREPDVGVALDPEWQMKTGQLPGKFYGRTTGGKINEVAAYLANLVSTLKLPEKALVKDEAAIAANAGVVVIKSVDGLGPKAAKKVTYTYLVKSMAPAVHAGFKLFFDEDTRGGNTMMTPAEVLGLTPRPEYVMYE